MLEATQQRGLAGKERRKRDFQRARRRYADHLVDEYFDAEVEVDRGRRIPIRRCSAYLANSGQLGGEDVAHGVQMEFALDEPQRVERFGDREVVWPPAPRQAASTAKLIDESMVKLHKPAPSQKTSDAGERAIRFETRSAPTAPPATSLPFPQEWRPPMGYRSRKRGLSFAGFAYGCLLGGAAAACLLLIVHVLLR